MTADSSLENPQLWEEELSEEKKIKIGSNYIDYKKNNYKKYVSFLEMFKSEWSIVLIHFFLTTLKTVIYFLFLAEVIGKLFAKDPVPIIKLIEFWPFNKFDLTEKLGWENVNNFLSFFIFFLLLYFAISYVDQWLEYFLVIKIKRKISGYLLSKFRKLNPINRNIKRNEFNNILKNDVDNFSEYWEHLVNHTYHNILSLLISVILLIFEEKIFESVSSVISINDFLLFVIFAILANVFNYFFTGKILKDRKTFNQILTEESGIINVETNNINLIDNMGLIPDYEEKWDKISSKVENFSFHLASIDISNKVIVKFMIWLFPFVLTWLNAETPGNKLIYFWNIFNSLEEIFECWWDYADYSNSSNLINKFLSLPEKSNGLIKIDTNEKIISIEIKKGTFFYSPSLSIDSRVLKNYDKTFFSGKINRLKGKNGDGKSTIAQLILGSLTLWNGDIIIKTEKGEYCIDELDKRYWKEKNVAYCCNYNLFSEDYGSEGQRQWANIQEMLTRKKSAQIWIFDEAGNCLDIEKKKLLREKIKQLADDNKLIIYVTHDNAEDDF